MDRRRSRSELAIEEQLKQLDPNTERYQVLQATRDFKASWVALGELLTVVRENGSFRDWGYSSFDAYCRRELRIKRDTANKLTRSFSFLRDHKPERIGEPERDLPALEVVDLLSRAREKSKVNDEQFGAIREEVFAPEGGNLTRGQVMKRFREFDPDAFRTAPRVVKEGAGDGDLRKALLIAERLEGLLGGISQVSDEARQAASRVAGELRKIFQESERKSA